jgi:hypothetical protein
MNRQIRLFAVALSGSALLSLTSLPAMAQPALPGGPCAIAPDAVIAQALGPSASGVQAFATPTLSSCAVRDSAAETITIFRISGPPDTDDLPTGPGDASNVVLERTPVDGVGDSALLIRLQTGEGILTSLRVQRGGEVFAFMTKDGPDVPARLTALAQAVLASLG